jgi:hypothetical protein
MHPVSVHRPPLSRTPGFLLTLSGFADEVCGTFARLIAYVGTLALIAILAVAVWQHVGSVDTAAPAARSAWTLADDAIAAFFVGLTDQPDKSATYPALRHPAGGRKDPGTTAGGSADWVTSADNPRLRGPL